jgi:hypothetical protein
MNFPRNPLFLIVPIGASHLRKAVATAWACRLVSTNWPVALSHTQPWDITGFLPWDSTFLVEPVCRTARLFDYLPFSDPTVGGTTPIPFALWCAFSYTPLESLIMGSQCHPSPIPKSQQKVRCPIVSKSTEVTNPRCVCPMCTWPSPIWNSRNDPIWVRNATANCKIHFRTCRWQQCPTLKFGRSKDIRIWTLMNPTNNPQLHLDPLRNKPPNGQLHFSTARSQKSKVEMRPLECAD